MKYSKNVALIVEGRNASKHNVFNAQGWNTAKTMHQSHKEEMHQNTMYLPHKGEIQLNDAWIAQG